MVVLPGIGNCFWKYSQWLKRALELLSGIEIGLEVLSGDDNWIWKYLQGLKIGFESTQGVKIGFGSTLRG